MLIGWGPHRFMIPTYSVEKMTRSSGGRVAHAAVIGADQPTHLLGPDVDTLELDSTFFPHHFNRGGLGMLEEVRLSIRQQVPHMLVMLSGAVLGRWVGTSLQETRTLFDANGMPSKVETQLRLTRYVPGPISTELRTGLF